MGIIKTIGIILFILYSGIGIFYAWPKLIKDKRNWDNR